MAVFPAAARRRGAETSLMSQVRELPLITPDACGHRARARARRHPMNEKKALARTGPFGLLRQMTTELDRMFDDPWTFRWPAVQLEDAAVWAPKVDVFEKDNRMVTRIDLPGVKKDDLTVEVGDGQLKMFGERKNETEEKDKSFYRCEREYGSFYRAVPLPAGVKPEDVKATFENGVLEVSVPIPAAAKANGQKIPILEAGKKAAA
jgi:HSP20 family protein